MLQTIVIGNVGADAQVNNKDGREFVTFRVAHNDTWTDQSGQQHSTTIWVDCIMNGHPKVADFIKAGAQIYCSGRTSVRVYSSQKDRCMKAGLTINAVEVELCGGMSELVPKQLVVPETGALVDVKKYYQADIDTSKFKKDDAGYLNDLKGNRYLLVKGGWITPFVEENANGNG